METFCYPQFPSRFSRVHIALFTNVSNAAQLRSRIVQASLIPGPDGDAEREEVAFAFINARLICSLLHLRTAVVQAILAAVQGLLRTKTVHSEILWALNPNNNINEAIRRYGVSDTATSLFVVRIAPPELLDVQDRMKAVVSGILSPIGELENIIDWTSIKKYYKLTNEPSMKAVVENTVKEQSFINEIVVGLVATKSVLG